MRSRNFTSIIVLILIVVLSSCTKEKYKVLIVGDSISIGYTPFVKEGIADKADVFHNPGNAQHTGTGLDRIDEWIGDVQWDVIQFNWGLWDLCYRHPDSRLYGNRDKENGKITYSINEYAANLDSIVSILKSTTNAKLIFVTTSYVPEEEAGRFEVDAKKYNDAAKRIMKKHSIVVNDIYQASMLIHKTHGKGIDDVHYTEEGYDLLSQLVVKSINVEIDSK